MEREDEACGRKADARGRPVLRAATRRQRPLAVNCGRGRPSANVGTAKRWHRLVIASASRCCRAPCRRPHEAERKTLHPHAHGRGQSQTGRSCPNPPSPPDAYLAQRPPRYCPDQNGRSSIACIRDENRRSVSPTIAKPSFNSEREPATILVKIMAATRSDDHGLSTSHLLRPRHQKMPMRQVPVVVQADVSHKNSAAC